MTDFVEWFTTSVSLIAPVAVLAWLLFYRLQRKRLETLRFELRDVEEPHRPSFSDQVKVLLSRDDTTLRVLEEIFIAERSRFSYYRTGQKRIRVRALQQIQAELRATLKASVQDDQFPQIRDRVIQLIDEAQKQIDVLLEREPFEGLDDPEKSLLVDILEAMPKEKDILQQKALQLADIIKVKHQDIRNLQLENARAGAWSRWGTFGTIFFGILSLVLSLVTVIT